PRGESRCSRDRRDLPYGPSSSHRAPPLERLEMLTSLPTSGWESGRTALLRSDQWAPQGLVGRAAGWLWRMPDLVGQARQALEHGVRRTSLGRTRRREHLRPTSATTTSTRRLCGSAPSSPPRPGGWSTRRSPNRRAMPTAKLEPVCAGARSTRSRVAPQSRRGPYRLAVEIDVLLDPFGTSWSDLYGSAAASVEAGFAGIWTWDHLDGRVFNETHVHECWTVLTAIAV